MKTKLYTRLFIFMIIAGLLVSSTAFSQRFRYERGHHGHYYYYNRSYSYFHPFVSVHFGNYNYRYQRGYFYRPYGSFFQLVVPPFGVRISTLPFGYRRFYIGPDPYYYYNGIYYRPYANHYEVVAPPLGAVVDDLPAGARAKVIDGQKYYELDGTYYKEQVNEDNRVSYLVAGTDGVLNTDKSEKVSYESKVGDRIEKLPKESKSVVINGEKLYTTPSGLYYRQVHDGDKLYYELVGK